MFQMMLAFHRSLHKYLLLSSIRLSDDCRHINVRILHLYVYGDILTFRHILQSHYIIRHHMHILRLTPVSLEPMILLRLLLSLTLPLFKMRPQVLISFTRVYVPY